VVARDTANIQPSRNQAAVSATSSSIIGVAWRTGSSMHSATTA
jgi:hypothetical protein